MILCHTTMHIVWPDRGKKLLIIITKLNTGSKAATLTNNNNDLQQKKLHIFVGVCVYFHFFGCIAPALNVAVASASHRIFFFCETRHKRILQQVFVFGTHMLFYLVTVTTCRLISADHMPVSHFRENQNENNVHMHKCCKQVKCRTVILGVMR